MKRFWLILATFLGLATSTAPAFAALQATYTLNCTTVACGSAGNYGTVTLTQQQSNPSDATTKYVTVTVDLTTATNSTTFAGTGSGYAITWNIVGAPALTSVTITSPNAANFTVQNFNTLDHDPPAPNWQRYKATPFTSGNCAWNDASCMMYAIDYNIGGSGGNDKILVFDVKRTGGLLISDFNQTNSNGFFFTADVSGPCSPTCNVGSNTQVPEPGTVTMSIAGLMGLVGFAMLQRRRKLARA